MTAAWTANAGKAFAKLTARSPTLTCCSVFLMRATMRPLLVVRHQAPHKEVTLCVNFIARWF